MIEKAGPIQFRTDDNNYEGKATIKLGKEPKTLNRKKCG